MDFAPGEQLHVDFGSAAWIVEPDSDLLIPARCRATFENPDGPLIRNNAEGKHGASLIAQDEKMGNSYLVLPTTAHLMQQTIYRGPECGTAIKSMCQARSGRPTLFTPIAEAAGGPAGS